MTQSGFASQVLRSHFIPARTPTGKTLVVLHGRGDSHRGFLWLPEALGFTDLAYLLVDAPDPYFGGYSWYDLPPRQGPGVMRSRGLLDQLFQELVSADRAPENTAVLGFSQGCLMALEWGTRTELPLAGYVGISGYCYHAEAIAREASAVGRRARFLVTHGTEDDLLPFDTTEQQIQLLQAQGFDIDFHAYAKTHTIDDADELPVIRSFLRERLQLA